MVGCSHRLRLGSSGTALGRDVSFPGSHHRLRWHVHGHSCSARVRGEARKSGLAAIHPAIRLRKRTRCSGRGHGAVRSPVTTLVAITAHTREPCPLLDRNSTPRSLPRQPLPTPLPLGSERNARGYDRNRSPRSTAGFARPSPNARSLLHAPRSAWTPRPDRSADRRRYRAHRPTTAAFIPPLGAMGRARRRSPPDSPLCCCARALAGDCPRNTDTDRSGRGSQPRCHPARQPLAAAGTRTCPSPGCR